MNESLVVEARDRLQLQTIYLRDSTFSMHPDFEPSAAGEHEVMLMIGLESMEIGDFDASSLPAGAKPERSIHGEIAAGIRLVGPNVPSPADGNEGAQGPILVELKAKFRCEYVCDPSDTPSETAIREYLMHNAKMNVWPYWREFLQSTFARAQLPQITLPLMVIKPMTKVAPPIAEPIEAISSK